MECILTKTCLGKIDEKEIARIIRKFEKTINYHAGLISKSCGMDYDDAKQNIMIRVWKAARKFDGAKSQETTYFFNVIKKEKAILVKKYFEKNNKLEIVSYDQNDVFFVVLNSITDGIYNKTEYKKQTIVEKILIDEKIKEIEYLILKSKRNNNTAINVFQRLKDGMKIKQISEDLNISISAVCQTITRNIRPACKTIFENINVFNYKTID